MIKRLGCLAAGNPCETDCYPATYIGEFFNGQWQWNSGWFWLEIRGDGCICVPLDRTLAVELSAFDVVARDGEAEMTWRTASERENDHFEVERDSQLVGNVESLGSSSSGHNYSWGDRGLTNGHSYEYSLWAVDVMGQRSEMGTESITPTAVVVSGYALYANYPNPFNPETQIAFDLAEAGHVTQSVYNLLGREMARVADGSFTQGHHAVSF